MHRVFEISSLLLLSIFVFKSSSLVPPCFVGSPKANNAAFPLLIPQAAPSSISVQPSKATLSNTTLSVALRPTFYDNVARAFDEIVVRMYPRAKLVYVFADPNNRPVLDPSTITGYNLRLFFRQPNGPEILIRSDDRWGNWKYPEETPEHTHGDTFS